MLMIDVSELDPVVAAQSIQLFHDYRREPWRPLPVTKVAAIEDRWRSKHVMGHRLRKLA
jgi:hypothetical protein